MTEAHWRGTNLLTRTRPKVTGQRLFIAGDACAYAEPFTGEGMSWALWSGLSVSSLAIEGINSWHPQLEKKWHALQNKLSWRRARCQAIALALRSDIFRTMLINLSATLPGMINPLIQMISGTNTINVLQSEQCNRG